MKASKCLIADAKPSFIHLLWTWNILDGAVVCRIFIVCETGKAEADGRIAVREFPYSLINLITMQKNSNIQVLWKTTRSIFPQIEDR